MKMAVFFKDNTFCVNDFWMGAILMKMAVLSEKENTFCVNDVRNHFSMGAILMKMAILLQENASRVNVSEPSFAV